MDIIERLRNRDAVVVSGLFHAIPAMAEAAKEIELLRAIVDDACEVLRHYDLPEHAYHYERVLRGDVPLNQQRQE